MDNIITGPGDYVTRDGRRVTIHNIDGTGSAPARGAIWKEFRGKMRPRGFNIWQLTGSFKFVGESKADIVGPYVGE